MDFELGDRVVCVISYGNVEVGETGTLVDFEEYTPEYGVCWDNKNDRRHNCQGHCENKHGWYVNRRNIKKEVAQDLGEFVCDTDLFTGLFGS